MREKVSLFLRRFAIALITGFKLFVRPLLGPAACRFMPSCSQYAKEAIFKYGIIKGSYLAAKRILRCHPLNPGGYDPVP
ncbi:hypothetical protein Dip510_001164 [Elusimicrobium posterum]|uniref:membrane protein insertion efficiency factor YidD n=1 Tax=Elusimicrobium posterum TaxID=3116653 RepID=UPI003C73A490